MKIQNIFLLNYRLSINVYKLRRLHRVSWNCRIVLLFISAQRERESNILLKQQINCINNVCCSIIIRAVWEFNSHLKKLICIRTHAFSNLLKIFIYFLACKPSFQLTTFKRSKSLCNFSAVCALNMVEWTTILHSHNPLCTQLCIFVLHLRDRRIVVFINRIIHFSIL